MPFNYNTIAGPTPNPGGAETQTGFVVFGPSSVSSTSAIYTVDQQPMYVQAYNLSLGDVVTVEMVNGTGASIVTTPLAPVFGNVVMNPNRTKIRIDYPGRYRFVHTGPSPISSLLVTGFMQTMTHEPTLDLATALFDVLSTGTPIVTGVAPISVTGTGIIADPYIITAINASDADMEAGISTAVVVEPASLSHLMSADGFPTFNTRVGVLAAGNSSINTVIVGAATILPLAGSYNDGVFVGAGVLNSSVPVVATNVVSVGGSSLAGASGLVTGATAIGSRAANGTINFDGVAIGFRAAETDVPARIVSGSVVVGSAAALQGSTIDSVVVGHTASGLSEITRSVVVGSAAVSGTSGFFDSVGIGTSVAQNSIFLNSAIVIGSRAGQNVDYTVQRTNLPLPIPTNAIFIGNNAGRNETKFDVTIIGTNGDGSDLNATLDHQIILGNTTQTQLVTAGSVIAGGVIGPSDERLKKNVTPYTCGLDVVNKLDPVSFNWDEKALDENKVPHLKREVNDQQCGLIAQDVVKVLPEVITYPYQNDLMGIHYDRLIPVLLSAIKELSAQVTELQKKVGE